MSFEENKAKVTDEQLSIELTDEEMRNVSGGGDMSEGLMFCRNYVSRNQYMKFEMLEKCLDCHIYYRFGTYEIGEEDYVMGQYMCRELGIREGKTLRNPPPGTHHNL